MTGYSKKLAVILAFCVGLAFSAPAVLAATTTDAAKDAPKEVKKTTAKDTSKKAAKTTKTVKKAKKAPTAPININKASAKELQALSGIGKVLSQRIVDYRKKHGAFKNINDLMKVKGIGKVVLEKNRKYLKLK